MTMLWNIKGRGKRSWELEGRSAEKRGCYAGTICFPPASAWSPVFAKASVCAMLHSAFLRLPSSAATAGFGATRLRRGYGVASKRRDNAVQRLGVEVGICGYLGISADKCAKMGIIEKKKKFQVPSASAALCRDKSFQFSVGVGGGCKKMAPTYVGGYGF